MIGSRPPIEARLAAAGLPALPRTAWLEIDLDALVANLGTLRRAAGPGVRIEPVVKADAYGHGLVPIATALEEAAADGLGVATLDEGLALRRAGVRIPILVLYPVPPAQASVAARARLDLTVGPEPLASRLLATWAADRAAGIAPRRTLRIQLEVETGLGRGGVPVDGVVAAARAIRAAAGVRLTGLWTHLAAAEDPSRAAAQVAAFEAAVDALRQARIPVPGRHVAASGGLLSGVAALDAIRPGLAVYGLVPAGLPADSLDRATAASLRPVLSLHARPVRVADLAAGHGVSYGPTFVTTRPSRIATLPLGYGDGWPRGRSNQAEALVRGHRVPLVGSVAMDALMADVTELPGPPVTVDDEVTLIGEQGGERISVEDLARSGTTISWEVVTAMAARLPRVYDAAAGPRAVRTLIPER